jgi:lipopolysaccharide transport system ATP-binding protein
LNNDVSSPIAISARNVAKTYLIYDAPFDRIKQSLWRGRKRFYREFQALRDISFEIAKGETVGIVGRNGSGKSTLLQLICGTLAPTAGEIRIDGRIAALLELGAGFNPEFTGRENVYLNASIMGISNDEIDAQFDRIAAFADIGAFMEQPVRTYSSGMYVRLAFATAIHVSPDILIVDEALSVGDEAFQRKCYSRIRQIKDNGGTILFVSHAASAVVELCDRAILLDGGEILLSGKPKPVITQYHRLIYAPAENVASIKESIRKEAAREAHPLLETAQGAAPQTAATEDFFDPHLKPQSVVAYESLGARIDAPRITTPAGKPVNILRRGEDYIYRYDVHFSEPAFLVRCGTMIKTVSGLELGGLMTHPVGQGIAEIPAGATISPEFKFRCNLMPGVYFMNAGVAGVRNGEVVFLHRIVDAFMFRVQLETDLKVSGMVDFGTPEI